MGDDPLMRGLGWLSVGLGIPPLVTPGGFGRALGVGDAPRHRAAAAFVGVRELAAAAGLLGQENPIWLWSRVGGDLMDLTMLAIALKNHDGRGPSRTAAATAAVAGITGLDVYAAVTRSRKPVPMEVHGTTTVARSPQETYDLWRRLEGLPRFMAHVDEVRTIGNGRTHWRVSAPLDISVEWDAEIIDDVAAEHISWRSVEEADIRNAGDVRFEPAPGGRGTEVHVTLTYDMPGGKLGGTVSRLYGEDPRQQLDDDLRRFKQVAETGEVVRSEGAPGGKRARHEFPQHPAQPLSRDELDKETRA
jgi:uncharacterized membrane protein